MTDVPSTIGFLCHICDWRERAESHELMDIGALVRHGMRFHYLVREQIDEYLQAAYRVDRTPPLNHGAFSMESGDLYPDLTAEGIDLEGRKARGWFGVAKKGELQDEAETSEETSPQLNPLCNPALLSLNVYNSEEYGTLNEGPEHCGDPTSIRQAIFNNWEFDYPNYSSIFNNPNFGQWNLLSFCGNPYDTELDEFSFGSELICPMALSSCHPDPDDHHSSITNEAIALAQLDRDIIRTPLFTTQLEEYQKLCYSGPPEAFGAKLDGCYRDQRRDRLQVWPERVVVVEQMLEGSEIDIEVDDESVLVGSDVFGETGEGEGVAGFLMDLLDFERDCC